MKSHVRKQSQYVEYLAKEKCGTTMMDQGYTIIHYLTVFPMVYTEVYSLYYCLLITMQRKFIRKLLITEKFQEVKSLLRFKDNTDKYVNS